MMEWQDDKAFSAIYPHILHVEGGYVNDPKDRGGATNFGVAYNFNQAFLKRYGINKPEDMRKLTKNQAIDVYYRKYWLRSEAPHLPDVRLALVYFDHAINAGIGSANKLLKRLDPKVKYFLGNGNNLEYFGAQSALYVLERAIAYHTYRDYHIFGAGWMNRLRHITNVMGAL